MAVSIPIVTEFINDGIKKAERAFSDIRKAVGNAEGAMGKFQAGGKAAFDAVKQNATVFATAAGAAVVNFAIEGVQAFQQLAIEADKFASATGLAVDQASRMLEVTGDLGIDAGTVETAIGKMNQNLGKSPDLFEKLGVQVAYANDGTVDANETFLNTIDRLNKIKDPAERAKVATELLGKGWRDMSQLIQMGSDDLRASLAQVSSAKTITPEEAAKAKKFRDTMNDLKDVVEDLTLAVGQALLPALQTTADKMKDVAPAAELVGGSLEVISARMMGTPSQQYAANMNLAQQALALFGVELGKKDTQENVVNLGGYMERAAEGFMEMNQQTLNAQKYAKTKPLEPLTTAAENLATQIDNIDEAWARLTGNLDAQVAFDNAKQTLAELEAAASKAFNTGADSDIVKYNAVAAEFAGQLAAISEGLGNIASRDIKIRFEAEGPAAALALAAWYRGGGELKGLTASQLIGQSGFSFGVPGRASGGAVTAGGTYLVGERGPELLTMGASSGYITPNGAGSTINVTVSSADPNEVVRALQTYVRQSGPVPVTTRAI